MVNRTEARVVAAGPHRWNGDCQTFSFLFLLPSRTVNEPFEDALKVVTNYVRSDLFTIQLSSYIF